MILLEHTTYPKGTPRSMNHWTKMVGSLLAKADMNAQRFLLAELHAIPSINFVRSLIDRISEPYFLNTEDEFDLYHQHVLPESLMISKIIDPLSGANYNTNHFTSGRDTKEVILPTFGLIGPKAFSVYDKWDTWEDVAPIKLLSHDSDELHLTFHGGMIDFEKDIPSQVVFGVDVPALLWKYILYIKEENETFETVDRDYFITEFVLPYFYKDLVEAWLTRVVLSRFDAAANIDDEFAMPISNNSFVSTSMTRSAIADLDDMIQMLGANKVSMGTFLNSPMIGKHSLMDRIEIHSELYAMNNSPRYTGYELVKSSDLMSVLLGVITEQLEVRTTTKLLKDLKVHRDTIKRSRWQSHMSDKDLGYRALNFLDMVDVTLVLA
jgi:hypothetical protein